MNINPMSHEPDAAISRAKGPHRAGYENGLLTLLALAAALTLLNRVGIAYVFPQIKADFGLTNTQLGALTAVTALTWGASSLVCSFISDVFGGKSKLAIIICIVGFSVVGGLAGSIASFAALLALRAAMGVFEGPVMPLIQAAVARGSSAHRRGANLGVIIASATLGGGVIAPFIMMSVSHALGWRDTFHVLAVPGLLLALTLALFMKADLPAAQSRGNVIERLRLTEVVGLFTRINILVGLVGAVTLVGAAIAMGGFLPLFITERTAVAPELRIAILTSVAIASALGAIFMPLLSDRIGRKPCLIAATLAATLMPIALILTQQDVGFVWAVIPAALIGSGAFTLMIYVIPGEAASPSLVATTYAVLVFIGEVVGGATAPALAGFLSDRFDLSAAMWLCSGLSAIALFASFAVQEPRRASARRSSTPVT